MKCPKCGFTSFDYLDECNKCGSDLTMVSGQLGVIAVSPEDRAAVDPSGPEAVMDSSAGAGLGTLDAPAPDFLSDAEETDRAFEQSFEDLVEPTRLDEEPEVETVSTGRAIDDDGVDEAPEADSDVEPDEEFLDLDFGNIFEDDDDKPS